MPPSDSTLVGLELEGVGIELHTKKSGWALLALWELKTYLDIVVVVLASQQLLVSSLQTTLVFLSNDVGFFTSYITVFQAHASRPTMSFARDLARLQGIPQGYKESPQCLH